MATAQLAILNTNLVYDDDTSIIPRSTTVVAKRLPPARQGKGGAARYVSGKMPQNAKNSHRSEAPLTKQASSTPANGLTLMNGAQTEEQRISAMFKMGADQWAQQQQEMAKSVYYMQSRFRCKPKLNTNLWH